MKVIALTFLSTLLFGITVCASHANSPHSISQPGSGWNAVEDITVNEPYPVNFLKNVGDTFDNYFIKNGDGFTMSSFRSRPSNSTATGDGFSSHEGSFKVVWTWEPTGTTPDMYPFVYFTASAVATIYSGTSPAPDFSAGANVGVSGLARASVGTYGHSAPYTGTDYSETAFEAVMFSGDTTCETTSHTVSLVKAAGQSFEGVGSLVWWWYSGGV